MAGPKPRVQQQQQQQVPAAARLRLGVAGAAAGGVGAAGLATPSCKAASMTTLAPPQQLRLVVVGRAAGGRQQWVCDAAGVQQQQPACRGAGMMKRVMSQAWDMPT